MAATYTPIASITLGASASDITFTSIPQTYTDLILICSVQNSAGSSMTLQFNSDTGANYSTIGIQGNGTVVQTRSLLTRNQLYVMEREQIAIAANTFSTSIINVMNYSKTTTFKPTVSRSGTMSGSFQGSDCETGRWASTAAINAIRLFPIDAGSFTTGSTFNLYGILAGS
jgi:hypothetical protein